MFLDKDTRFLHHLSIAENQKLQFPKEEAMRKDKLMRLVLLPQDIRLTDQSFCQGCFGMIDIGLFHGKTEVAVKTFRNNSTNHQLTEQENHLIENEILLLSYLKHSNIVGIYGIIHNSYQISAVLELSRLGTLEEFLSSSSSSGFPPSLLVSWFVDIASALEYIHRKHVKHGNLSPGNIMIFPSLSLKLSGFKLLPNSSSSSTASDSFLSTTTSRSEDDVFVAPEVRIHQQHPHFASDIYAFAITVVYSITRKKPLLEGKIQDQIAAAVAVLTERSSTSCVSSSLLLLLQRFQSFLLNCIEYDPSIHPNALRPTAATILYEVQQLLSAYGDDPRRSNETLIETLEKEILRFREEKPLEEQKKPLSTSPSASSLLSPYFSTPIIASEENKPLRDLTPEEAMAVLTRLGFKPDSLSSDATSLQIDEIDGELLDIIESVSECAEIGINKPIHLMKRFLKKLDELRDLGVPKVLYYCEEEDREREEKENEKKVAKVDDTSKPPLEEKHEKEEEKQLERIFSEESWERGDNEEDAEEEDEIVDKSSSSPIRSKSPEVDFLSNPATNTPSPSEITPIPSLLQHVSESDDLVSDEFLIKILDSQQPSDSSDTSFPHVAILFSRMDMKECRVLSFPASSRLSGVPYDVLVISKLFLLSSNECWNEDHHRNKLEKCLLSLSLDMKKIIVYGDKELMEGLLRTEVSTNRKKDDEEESLKAKKSRIVPNQNDGIHLPTCLQCKNSLVSKVLKVKYQQRLKNGPDIASFTCHRLIRKYGMWSDNNDIVKDYHLTTTSLNKVEMEFSKRYLGDKQKQELKTLEEQEKKKTGKKREKESQEKERERNKTEIEKRKRERQFKRRKTHGHSELQTNDEKELIKEEVKSEEKESNVLLATEDKRKERVGTSDVNIVEAITEEVTESAETVPVRESGLLTLILFLKLLFFTKRKKFPFATTLSMLDSLLKPFHRKISLYRNYEFYGMRRPSWKSLKKKERLAGEGREEKEKEEGADIDIFYSQHKRVTGFTDYQMIGFSSFYEIQKIDRVGDLLRCWERKQGQPAYCPPYIYNASSYKPRQPYRSILFEIISPMKVTSSPMKFTTSAFPTLPSSRPLLASTLFYDSRFPLTSSSSKKKKSTSTSTSKQQDSSFLYSRLNRKDSTHLLDWEELQYTSPLIMSADPNRLNGFDQWNEENIEMTIENLQTMIRFLQSQQEKGLLILSNSIDYEATLNQYQLLLSVLTGNDSGKEEFLSSAVVTGIRREKLQLWCEKVREIEDDDNEYQEKEHVEMRERKEKREENRSRNRHALPENCPESSVLLPLVPSFREEIIVTDEFDNEKFPLRNRCRELLNILLRNVGMISSINGSSNSSRRGESKALLYYGNQWNVFLSVDLFNIVKKILTLLYSNEFGKKERFFFSYTRCLEEKEVEENGKQKMSPFSLLLVTKEEIIRFINLKYYEQNDSSADSHNRNLQQLSVNLLSSFPSSDSRTKEEEELVEKETVKMFEMLLEIWETKHLSGTLFHSSSMTTAMVASYEGTDFFYYSSFITSLFQQYSTFMEDAVLPSFFSTQATTSSFSSEDRLLLEKKLKSLLRYQLIRLFVKEIQTFIQEFQDFFLVYSSRFLSPFDEQSRSRRKKKKKNQKEKRRDVKKGRNTPLKGIAEVVDSETEGNEKMKEKYSETASKRMFERSNHQLSIETILQERKENDFVSLILYNLSYYLSSEFSVLLRATSPNKTYVFFREAISFFVSTFPEPSDDAVDRKVIAASSSVKDELLTSFHSIWKEWKTWKSFFFPEKSLNVIELLKAMSYCFYFKQFFLSYMKSSSSSIMKNLLSDDSLSSPSVSPSSISLRSSSIVTTGDPISAVSAFLSRFPGISQFFFRSRWHYGASLMTFTALSPASLSTSNQVTSIVKRLEAFDEFDCFEFPLLNEIREKLNILLRKCQLHLYYERNWQRFLKEDLLLLLKKLISVMFAFELDVKFLFLSAYRQFEERKEKESVQFISSIDDLLSFIQTKYDEEVISSSLVVESSDTKIAAKNVINDSVPLSSLLLKKDLLLKTFRSEKKDGKPLPFIATTEEIEKEIIKLLTMCDEIWERRNETGKIKHLQAVRKERNKEKTDSFIFDYFYFTSSILTFSQKLSTAIHHHLLSTFFPKSVITPSEDTSCNSNDVLIEKKIQNTILSYFEKQCYEKTKFFMHLLIMFINEMDLIYPFFPFMDDTTTLSVEAVTAEEKQFTEEKDTHSKERNDFRYYYAYHDGSREAMKTRNLENLNKRENRKKQKVINEAKQQCSLQSSEQPISLKTVNLEKIQKERDLKEMIKLIQVNLHTKVLSTSFSTDKEKDKEKTKKWKIFESAISAWQKNKGRKLEEEAESSCRTHLKRWNEWAFLSLCSTSFSSSVVSSSTAEVCLSLVQHLKLVAFSYLFESFFVSFISSSRMHPLSSLTIHSNVSPFLPFLLPYIHRLRLLHGVSLLSISTEKKGKGKDTSHKILVKKLEMSDDFEMLRYPLRYEAKHILNDLLVTSAYSLCCEKSWKLFMKNHICRLLIKVLYRWYGYEGGNICHVTTSSVTHHSSSTTVVTPTVTPVVTSSTVASSHNRFKQFHKKLQKKEDLLDYINEKYQHESFLFSRLQQKRLQEKALNTIPRQELATTPEQPLLSEVELIDKKKLLIIITIQQVEGEGGEKLTVRRRSVVTSSSVSNSSGSTGSSNSISSSSSNPSNNEMEVEVLKVMKIMKRIHEMKSALRTVPSFKNNLSFSYYTVLSYEFSYFFTTSHIKQLYFKKIEEIKKRIFPKIVQKYQILFNTLQPYCSLSKPADKEGRKPRTGGGGVHTSNENGSSLEAQLDDVREEGEINQQKQEEKTKQQILQYLEETLLIKKKPYLLKSHIFKKMKKYLLSSIQMLILKFKQFLTASFQQIIPFKVIKEGKKEKLVIRDSFRKIAKKDCVDYNHLMEKVQEGDEKEMFTCIAFSMKHLQRRKPFSLTLALYEKYWEINKEYVYTSYCNHLNEWKMWMKQQSSLSGAAAVAASSSYSSHSSVFALFSSFSSSSSLSPSHALDFYRIGCYCFYFDLFIKEYSSSFLSSEKVEKYMDTYCQFIKRSYESRLEMDLMKQGCNTSNTFSWKEYQEQLKHYPRISIPLFGVLEEEERERKSRNKKVFIGIPKFFLRSSYHQAYYSSFLQIHERNQFLLSLFSKLSSHNLISSIQQIENLSFLCPPPSFVRRVNERQAVKPSPGKKWKYLKQRKPAVAGNDEREEQTQEQKHEKKEKNAFIMSLPQVISQEEQDVIDQQAKEYHQKKIQELINNCYQLVKKRNL
jgi:serine/threonine protein kinase